ncbi:DUF2971 domain-containing protein [Neisseria sicca]|jgi:hypothetical protein|uniref:PF11185 family protein n=1 Tax=Neisseria sicca VK64 TaxID=1095748 RepID=I2NX44_NEISI|nr:DUF2971 domain-containing protein [Neisseria sicca]EIG30405.1 PF11185 family protein [Neisseria sicca VK64]
MFDSININSLVDKTIYHYCDAHAFLSICQNKKLWFNDLHSMNDFSERHYGYEIWELSASQVISEEIGKMVTEDEKNKKIQELKVFLDKIDEFMHLSGRKYIYTAACFSRNSDLLSQWRGYANDGQGYCIGFDIDYLLQLNSYAVSVLYNREKQVKESVEEICHLIQLIKNEKWQEFEELVEMYCLNTAALKNSSFSEEEEVRLLYPLSVDENLKVNDILTNPPMDVKFRIKQNIPTPYIEIPFDKGAIREVIIGPKNPVLETAISIFLETNSLRDVKVRRSIIPYC